jgi:hypothetical protein
MLAYVRVYFEKYTCHAMNRYSTYPKSKPMCAVDKGDDEAEKPKANLVHDAMKQIACRALLFLMFAIIVMIVAIHSFHQDITGNY